MASLLCEKGFRDCSVLLIMSALSICIAELPRLGSNGELGRAFSTSCRGDRSISEPPTPLSITPEPPAASLLLGEACLGESPRSGLEALQGGIQ